MAKLSENGKIRRKLFSYNQLQLFIYKYSLFKSKGNRYLNFHYLILSKTFVFRIEQSSKKLSDNFLSK